MKRKPYPTALSDKEWEMVKGLLPEAKPGGRPRSIDLREVLNGIFYRQRTGCAWEMLPDDLPPTKTVYDYFSKWSKDGTWERINAVLVRRVRVAEGRDEEPSAAIIDAYPYQDACGTSMVVTIANRSKRWKKGRTWRCCCQENQGTQTAFTAPVKLIELLFMTSQLELWVLGNISVIPKPIFA